MRPQRYLQRQLAPAGSRIVIATILAVCLLLSLAIGLGVQQSHARLESRMRLMEEIPARSSADYFVGSRACRSCHPAAYHSWHESFHRTMTQAALPETVVGDFNDVKFDYFGTPFHLQRRGSEFWVTIGDMPRRVVQTTGSHHYQMYWLATDHGNRLENLPFVYLIDSGRWVRRNDVFMVPPELASQPEGVRIWNDSCIKCHTTHGRPHLDDQHLNANTEVADLGIHCESCHGPGADHVAFHSNPLNRYKGRLWRQSESSMVDPERLPARVNSDICGQCHSIFAVRDPQWWNRAGFDYRAGDDLQSVRTVLRHPARHLDDSNRDLSREFLDKYFWSDGMVRVSGREYNGLIESPCYQRGKLSCLSCHQMHGDSPDDQLKNQMRGDRACLQCHSELSRDLESHTHHAADSSGSRCYNCHMPHTTYGLVKAIRSHEISSPDVESSVLAGRPNACNLCHLDTTLQWTNDWLSKWYGRTPVPLDDDNRNISAAARWLLAGDAGQRAILAWHAGWPEAQQVSGTDWLVPLLAELLTDDYAVVRSLAGRSLSTMTPWQDLDYDYTDTEPRLQAVADQVRRRWERQNSSGPDARNSALLLDEQGRVDQLRLSELLRQQDKRPVDLLE